MSVCSNFQGEPVDLKADIAVLHTLLDLRLVKRAYIAPAVVVHPGVGGITFMSPSCRRGWIKSRLIQKAKVVT